MDPLWYKKYNESYLNKLVDQALANNYDLKTAALNVESAYANLGLNRADLFPTLNSSWNGGARRD
ncbi:MAG: TolC family protein, partial [Campylobacter sp.]|nr:TolC family protein [Campylobacter sp.]